MKQERQHLFGDMAELWLKRLSPELKASSEAKYRNILNGHLLPAFGAQPVTAITREQAEDFRLKLLWASAGEEALLSSQTAAAILSIFKRIMAFASRETGLPVVDTSDLAVRQSTKPLRVFSREEQRAISQYVVQHGSLADAGILLSLYTGLRIGEVCALRWKCISLDSQSLLVEKTMQRVQAFREDSVARKNSTEKALAPAKRRRPKYARTNVVITEPKSACSVRSIPLPDALTAALKPLEAPPDCFLLTGKPDHFVEPRTLENHFVHVMDACGIKGATFHTCRHTFATRCIELGFDMKSLSEILGHANVNITLNRYVHPSMEFKRENMNKVSGLFLKDQGKVRVRKKGK